MGAFSKRAMAVYFNYSLRKYPIHVVAVSDEDFQMAVYGSDFTELTAASRRTTVRTRAKTFELYLTDGLALL